MHGQAGIGCTACHADLEGIKEFPHAEKLSRPKCEGCHDDVTKKYSESVHGQAVGRVPEPLRPTCEHCHGEHAIGSHYETNSPIYTLNIAKICSKCHEDQGIAKKYDLPAERLKSYSGTYHGAAGKPGDIKVANCASCHGNHDILASSDPQSPTNPANLQKTCGQCS